MFVIVTECVLMEYHVMEIISYTDVPIVLYCTVYCQGKGISLLQGVIKVLSVWDIV
jgi:hypothetical protein